MKAEEIEELAELAYPISEDIYKELWTENQAYKKGYIHCQETMQNDIDELLEFINRQISESNFINEGDKFEAYELIQKHTKKQTT